MSGLEIAVVVVVTAGFISAMSWLGYQITKDQKRKMREREVAEAEWKKCQASPYYYYTKYWKIDGKSATTMLSEKEFNQQYWALMGHEDKIER